MNRDHSQEIDVLLPTLKPPTALPSFPQSSSGTSIASKVLSTTNADSESNDVYNSAEWTDPTFTDIKESREALRASGAKTANILFDISRMCIKKSDGIPYIRCLASKTCKYTAQGHKRAKGRLLKHAADCKSLPSKLQLNAIIELAGSQSIPGPGQGKHSSISTSTLESQPFAKKAKTKLAGSEIKTPQHAYYHSAGSKNLKETADYNAMLMITCNDIPHHFVDSHEFKAFCSTLNTDYSPLTRSVLVDRLIPAEAARIKIAVDSHLRLCWNLTISFDGGGIRNGQSFYSVHITTQDQRTFLIELDNASRLRHDHKYIVELLTRVSTD